MKEGESLIVHLRMTGKLFMASAAEKSGKHTHVVIQMDNGELLHFQDPRKFGRIWLVNDPLEVLHKLGLEPFDPAFTPEYLAERCSGRRASIKALLLDQGIIAGVGNIYADEALFDARVHPARAAGDLTVEEFRRLHGSVISVLAQAIDLGGSSLGGSALQNYMRADGEQGGFQERHRVFRRTNQPCEVCGAQIERIVIAQRSTHFCPICQPRESAWSAIE
ncbi:MAG: bifunctional DNA-formamidopyrimidine glycosylase/DNA-(apurinic or apyrimidinic site) lyase [Caldilineaceae bacterium]|nr:bifunctional DNA-formamidopyrimidine glycosylase/DNA-(apurinic or apyrimidinic site) lyase [Caldilineaceae bacterium]